MQIVSNRNKRVKELDNALVKLKGQDVWSDKVENLGVWVVEGVTRKDHIAVLLEGNVGD